MNALADFVGAELAAEVPAPVRAFAEGLAEAPGAAAILYYGSTLRTGDLSGLLDFYVLTHGARRPLLWPEVTYREVDTEAGLLRAKIAWMPLDVFHRAAAGASPDSTIWTRFSQPAALVWSRDAAAREAMIRAVAAAAATASGFAAALGPAEGPAQAFWSALFRKTYGAEFRVEDVSRAETVAEANAGRNAAILPLAWRAAGIGFEAAGDELRPRLTVAERRRILGRWRVHGFSGKPLNLARLVKAAFTFDGAARYAAWKVERHTGVKLPVTPFAERHPILAAPGAAWRLWRARRKTSAG